MTPIEFRQKILDVWAEMTMTPYPPKESDEWAHRLDQYITNYCAKFEDILEAAKNEDWAHDN